MRTNRTPVGPEMESPRTRRIPFTVSLVDGAGAAYEPDGAVYLRIGSAGGGTADYEVAMSRVSAGLWSCYVEPVLDAASYAYRVYDEDADRDLLEGVWVLGPTLD